MRNLLQSRNPKIALSDQWTRYSTISTSFKELWSIPSIVRGMTTQIDSNIEKRTATKTDVKSSIQISIDTSDTFQLAQLMPVLKSGIQISQPSSKKELSLIIASAYQAIEIHHPGARAIIARLDGAHSAKDISQEISAPLEVVEKVIEQLLIARLIDTTKSKLRLHNRFSSPIEQRAINNQDQSNDAFYRQLQQRIAPELAMTTWIDGVTDGGVTILSARQSFDIEIYGNNRVATLIYLALLASGVTNTKFSIGSRREQKTIGDADLGTGVLRTNDFGLDYKTRVAELSREWSLFPTPFKKQASSQVMMEKNLRIIVGNYSPELINQLMRDGSHHLFVGQIMGGTAQCGPLVWPQHSPCKGCAELAKTHLYGDKNLVPLVAAHDELPVALGFQVAGSAVQAVLQFIDTGRSELLGAQINFDYLSPSKFEIIRISRHPQCMCNWN